MRVLVTGAAGFIGGHVVEYLRDKDYEVVGHDVVEGPFVDARGDLTSQNAFSALAGCDAICHIGGIGDVYLAGRQPALAYQTNLLGTQRVVEAANAGLFRKIVYASTWEVYGEPHYQPLDEQHPTVPDHPYNISKLAGELAVRSAPTKVPTTCLRLGTSYGPRMRTNAVIPLFINRGMKGATISLQGGGEQFRQFTYVTDICRAFELSLAPGAEGVFNIVSPERVTIRQIAERVADEYPTLGIEVTPARLGDVPPAEVSSAKAMGELGWSPEVTFDEGFEAVFSWMTAEALAAA